MYYIVDSSKAFHQAAADLEAAVKHHGFGVLHVHDLGNTLRSKDVTFTERCRGPEVCSPAQAAKAVSTVPQVRSVSTICQCQSRMTA